MEEIFNKPREIRKREYQIHCPVCGKHRFNLMEGTASFQCEKCKAYVAVIVKDSKVLVYEDDASNHENVWPGKCGKPQLAGSAL